MTSRRFVLVVLVFSALSGRAAPQSEASREHPDLRMSSADRALLSHLVEESGAETNAPSPGVLDYVGELTRRFMEWVSHRLRPARGFLDVVGTAFGAGARRRW